MNLNESIDDPTLFSWLLFHCLLVNLIAFDDLDSLQIQDVVFGRSLMFDSDAFDSSNIRRSTREFIDCLALEWFLIRFVRQQRDTDGSLFTTDQKRHFALKRFVTGQRFDFVVNIYGTQEKVQRRRTIESTSYHHVFYSTVSRIELFSSVKMFTRSFWFSLVLLVNVTIDSFFSFSFSLRSQNDIFSLLLDNELF